MNQEYISTSASVVDAMMPVKLDAERLREYNSFLYPKRGKPPAKGKAAEPKAPVKSRGHGMPIKRTDIADILYHCWFVSGALADLQELCAYFLSYGSHFESQSPTSVGQAITAYATNMISNRNSKNVDKIMDVFMENREGVLIRDSTRHKGGKSVIFAHCRSSNFAYNIPSSSSNSLVPNKTNHNYEREHLANYSTPLSQQLVEFCKEMSELVVPGRSITKAGLVKINTLPFNFDFKQLLTRFTAITGYELPDAMIPDAPKVHPDAAKYFSIAIGAVPSYDAKSIAGGNVEAIERRYQEMIPEEHFYIGFKYETTLAVDLPQDWVKYIIQSEKGELLHYCLNSWAHNWSTFFLRPKGSGTGGLSFRSVPRFVIPASRLNKLRDVRKAAGAYVDPGRSNDDGLLVDPVGRIMYLPRDSSAVSAIEMEKEYDAILEERASLGITKLTHVEAAGCYGLQRDQMVDYNKRTQEVINKHANKIIDYSWDYNTVVYSSATLNPNNTDLVGARAPDPVTIAQLLGMDISSENETYRQLKMSSQKALQRIAGDSYYSVSIIAAEFLSSRLPRLIAAGIVPDAYVLIDKARKQLGLPETQAENPYEFYMGLGDRYEVPPGLSIEKQCELLNKLFVEAYNEATSTSGRLFGVLSDEMGARGARDQIAEHERHYPAYGAGLARASALYKYLGGLTFFYAMEAVVNADSKALFAALPNSYNDCCTLLPVIQVLTKYVPRAETIFAEAEAYLEKIAPKADMQAEDIELVGVAKDTAMMPHQVDGFKITANKPQFAILDVGAGGGKTQLTICDIAYLAKDEVVKPVIAVPDNLISNWASEIDRVTAGQWNVIPLNTDTVNTWGYDKLDELLRSAPENTIVVCGIYFLARKWRETVTYGRKIVNVFGAVELLLRHGYNYFAVDESHKVKTFNQKGKTSSLHMAVKRLCCTSGAKYVRLCTGTLIHNVLSDVVGQTAILNPAVFQDAEKFEEEFASDISRGAEAARSKLSKYVALVTKRRRDWAYVLPNPIDTFITVPLESPHNPGSEIHAQAYHAVLKSTLSELEDELKKRKKSGGDDDDSDDSDDGDGAADNDGADVDSIGKVEDEDPDDEGEELAGINMKYYLQRIEQLLMDPYGDPLAAEALHAAGIKDFMSNKMRAVLERIEYHFRRFKYDATRTDARYVLWEKGMTPRELDVVEYEGNLYMARRVQYDQMQRQTLPASMTPPPEDPDYWKPELPGKVMVICRYIRSVNAIYNALPADLKPKALRFHGQLGTSESADKNLELFKTKPEFTIILANEEKISEGHNVQIASRQIRAETPWTPGALEQTAARIARPDWKTKPLPGSKPGDLAREVIYIDWIMTEGTMEVAKVARLMQKAVERARFDEKDNKNYAELQTLGLEPIKMARSLLTSMASMDDFLEYFQAKRTLNEVEAAEFTKMRHESKRTTLEAVTPLPAKPNFRIMESVPMLRDQHVYDHHGYGLTRFIDWTANHKEALTKDLDIINGMPVKTEFGYGTIVGYRKAAMIVGPDGEKSINPVRPVSSLTIQIGKDDPITVDPSKVHVATKISDEELKRVFGKTKKSGLSAKDRKRQEELAAIEEKKDKDAETKRTTRKERDKDAMQEEKDTSQRIRRRRENIRQGRDVNDGITYREKVPRVADGVKIVVDRTKPNAQPKGEDMKLRVQPLLFNGFMAMFVSASDPDSKVLKDLKFKSFGSYVYIDVANLRHFDALWEYMEKYFIMDRGTQLRMTAIEDSFNEQQRLGFNLRQGVKAVSELPMFFQARHKEGTDRKSIKAYPCVLEDRVRIMIDLTTNPAIKKHIGRVVPGAGRSGTWKLSEGMHIYFAFSKTDAKAVMKDIERKGITVVNKDKASAAIDAMKLYVKKRGA